MKFVNLDFIAAAQPDTLVMPEIGYLLLTLAAVAVLLFCWLAFASPLRYSQRFRDTARFRKSGLQNTVSTHQRREDKW